MGLRRRRWRELTWLFVAAGALTCSCVVGVHGFELEAGVSAIEPGTTFTARLVNTCRDKSRQVEVCVEKSIESAARASPQFELVEQHPSATDADGVQAIDFTVRALKRADELCVEVNKSYRPCVKVTVRTVDAVKLKPVCVGVSPGPWRVRTGRVFQVAAEFSGEGSVLPLAVAHGLEVDPGAFTEVQALRYLAPEVPGAGKLSPVKPAGRPLTLEVIDAAATPPRLEVTSEDGRVSWRVGFDDSGVLCEEGSSEVTSTTPLVCTLKGGVASLVLNETSAPVERLTPGVCGITVTHLPTGLTSSVSVDDTQLWFVTSATFDGALGGRAGADEKCAQAASAAGLARPRWSAYLATKSQTLGALNLALGTGLKGVPFKNAYLVTGKRVTSMGAVTVGEGGTSVTGEAWTGGTVEKAGSERPNCAEWTRADGETGRTGHLGAAPTNNGIEPVLDDVTRPCTERHHLYCVGDAPPAPAAASPGTGGKSGGCSATGGASFPLVAMLLVALRRGRRPARGEGGLERQGEESARGRAQPGALRRPSATS